MAFKTTIRLKEQARRNLRWLARRWRLSQTKTLEQAIVLAKAAEMDKAEGEHHAIPQPQ